MTRPTTARPVLNLIGACKMTDVKNMTDADLTEYLVQSSSVPQEALMAYAAGYFESILLSLMARFPEVRREIEERVRCRMKDSA